MCLRIFVGLILAASFLHLAGCSPAEQSNEIVVTGQLLDDGKPAKVDVSGGNLPPGEEVGRMIVRFYQIQSEDERLLDEKGESLGVPAYTADLEGTGKFRILGPSGVGIPFGKYRVVVKHVDPFTGKDLLGRKFDEGHSKIFVDIDKDTKEIEIDLAKP